MTNNDLFRFVNEYEQLINLPGKKFAYAVLRNKERLITYVSTLFEGLDYVPGYKEYVEKKRELNKKYKDSKANGVEIDLQSEVLKLDEQYKDTIEKYKVSQDKANSILSAQPPEDLLIYVIDQELVPESITVDQYELIDFFVKR
jgi:hypothetical protein